ncbi:hypothetical protein HBO38_36130 [Pseudomonas veronii]|uniref:Uncharacterized protein n=1 Tax=Pseudomonas veronii TaxID=76761 RepID=A0A7Y1ADF2_PSEVE|nr:hypothetical protein [Pseudomonas veronii]NMY13738.1 hypothetical protein [Pseudomonas veronii]
MTTKPDTAKEQPNTWTQGGQAKYSNVKAAVSKFLDSEVPTSVSLITGGEARSTLEPFLRLDGSIYSMLSAHEKDLVKSLIRTGRKLGLAVSVLTSEEDRQALATASPEQAEQILSRGNNVVSVKLSAA